MTTPRIPRDHASLHNSTRKMTLRTTLLSIRKHLDPAHRELADQQLSQRVIDWCQSNSVTCLGVYLPIRGEPDLALAYRHLCASGITLALPVVRDKQAPLTFIVWQPGDAVITGAYGTTIPQGNIVAAPDTLLLPCVGFNTDRFRLGYGGGYYDRTLDTPDRPRTVGIAYDCTEAQFSHEAHDIAVDTILTETRLL